VHVQLLHWLHANSIPKMAVTIFGLN
jgi:hypothetical protein